MKSAYEHVIYKLVGRRIRERRKAAFLARETLAAMIGWVEGVATMASIESGYNSVSIPALYDMADVLDCNVSDLVPRNREVRVATHGVPRGEVLSVVSNKHGCDPVSRAIHFLICERIRARRLEAKATIVSLAHRLDWMPSMVYDLENKEGARLPALYEIANAFRCEVRDLLPSIQEVGFAVANDLIPSDDETAPIGQGA